MSSASKPTILVSVLPRGEAAGSSALVALDGHSLEPLATREFPPEEYLRDPQSEQPGAIHHCRGIAQAGDTLLATLFNGVREYAVEDARKLVLRPRRLLTHPHAVDLHGLDVGDGLVLAASTGSESVIAWELASGRATEAAIGNLVKVDLRFPDRLAREAGYRDWRHALAVNLHLNSVCHRDDGTTIACGLTSVLELSPQGHRTLITDPQARMHDGRDGGRGDVLLTDAARGALVSLDLDSGERRFLQLAAPDEWFVRGVEVADRFAFVLRSEPLPSRQRHVHRDDPGTVAQDGRFGISVVDLDSWQPIAERTIRSVGLARGSVAYAALEWAPPVSRPRAMPKMATVSS
jgi:hypothetical protein